MAVLAGHTQNRPQKARFLNLPYFPQKRLMARIFFVILKVPKGPSEKTKKKSQIFQNFGETGKKVRKVTPFQVQKRASGSPRNFPRLVPYDSQ